MGLPKIDLDMDHLPDIELPPTKLVEYSGEESYVEDVVVSEHCVSQPSVGAGPDEVGAGERNQDSTDGGGELDGETGNPEQDMIQNQVEGAEQNDEVGSSDVESETYSPCKL